MKKKILSIISLTIIVLSALVFAVSCDKAEEPITTYGIWLDIHDDNTIECSQKVEVVNNYGVALDELKFNVYANAFDKRKPLPCAQEEQADFYPDGISYGEFSLTNVYGDMKQYDFDFESSIITVELNSPLEVGQRTSVDMRYTLSLPHTNGRYGFNEKGISLTGFYPMLCAFVGGQWYYDEYSPIGDPYFSDVAKYEVTFNLPNGWEYVSSGKSKQSQENGETIVSSTARNIRDFALILSPTLNKSVKKYGKVEISYLGEKSETLNIAQKALEVYGKLFGDYAYDTLAIADMPFVAGGMEYGALCVINEALGGATYEEVVAHEIAHQWWYGAVGSNNLIDAWQDEGLTSYATYLYFVAVGNVEYSSLMLNDAYSQFHRFIDIQNSVGETAKGKLGGKLNDFPSNYYYTNITYNKSLVMWKYLQDTLGKDTVQMALKEYYATYKFKIATPDNLYSCLDNNFDGASALMKTWVANV
ncbi:MAG: M1 family metallopeptidase [Clostridia bacterium]|nr:M1 family metallopeptidase [Clostridia bacterium]